MGSVVSLATGCITYTEAILLMGSLAFILPLCVCVVCMCAAVCGCVQHVILDSMGYVFMGSVL